MAYPRTAFVEGTVVLQRMRVTVHGTEDMSVSDVPKCVVIPAPRVGFQRFVEFSGVSDDQQICAAEWSAHPNRLCRCFHARLRGPPRHTSPSASSPRTPGAPRVGSASARVSAPGPRDASGASPRSSGPSRGPSGSRRFSNAAARAAVNARDGAPSLGRGGGHPPDQRRARGDVLRVRAPRSRGEAPGRATRARRARCARLHARAGARARAPGRRGRRRRARKARVRPDGRAAVGPARGHRGGGQDERARCRGRAPRDVRRAPRRARRHRGRARRAQEAAREATEGSAPRAGPPRRA